MAEAIGEELAVDVAALSDEELHERVVGRPVHLARLAAVQASELSEWERRGGWAADGSRSASARLARDARQCPAAVRAQVRRARKLRSMPATAEALEAGLLSVDHVDVLIAANREGLAELFARDEPMLVGYGLDLLFEDFRRAVHYWMQLADDVAAEDRAERDRDSRRASVAHTSRGIRDVQARLDPIGGAIFENELARLERQLFLADWAEAEQVHGPNTKLDVLARTSAQRRADALVEMARRSAAKPAGAKEGRVLVSVLIDHPTTTGRICELLDGTVVTAGQIVPYLSEADMERIVFGGDARVLEVGRRTRFFTGALRRAIVVRDRHCTFPGCRERAEVCDVDHIVEYGQDGETTQDNGRLRCPTHNRQRPGRPRAPSDDDDEDGDGDDTHDDEDRAPPDGDHPEDRDDRHDDQHDDEDPAPPR